MIEEWRAVVGIYGYEVSNTGRVRSWRIAGGNNRRPPTTPRLLKIQTDRLGYQRVGMYQDGSNYPYLVHRVVLAAFIGPCPDGLVGTHLDGVQTNNTIGNLAWRTQKENIGDKKRHGTEQRGERNPFSTLTDEQVREIRALRALATQRELSRRYRIAQSSIWMIQHRKSWSHVA